MKPIIFSTEMVQAILEGRKTQTRRVVKADIVNGFDIDIDGSVVAYADQATGDNYKPADIAPYQPGDILYVRETWKWLSSWDCGNNMCNCETVYKDEMGCFNYRANYGTTKDDSFPPDIFKWKPSIHMPRAAARLFLEVKNVWVERLQDITEEDAIAEGFMGEPSNIKGESGESLKFFTSREDFAECWNSLYAKRGFPWESNPWVWVYEFERIETRGKNE